METRAKVGASGARRRRRWRWLSALWTWGRANRPQAPDRPLPLGLAGAALLSMLLAVACEQQPERIRVKLPRDAVQSVKMDPSVPPFEKKGDTIHLRASAFDKQDTYMGPAKVKWTVSDPTVASVNYEGLVTVLSSGEAKVIATTEGYEKTLTAELPIKVVIIDKVKIVPPAETKVHLGETVQFKAEVYDDRGKIIPDAKVSWRCSDYAATVSVTGEVEGRAIGDTQVIAESGSKIDRFTIDVLDWKKGAK
ncbi:MAG: Ig-like domain-containing protein [Myxococcota bacterium]